MLKTICKKTNRLQPFKNKLQHQNKNCPIHATRLTVRMWAVLSVFLIIMIYRDFYVSIKGWTVSCQFYWLFIPFSCVFYIFCSLVYLLTHSGAFWRNVAAVTVGWSFRWKILIFCCRCTSDEWWWPRENHDYQAFGLWKEEMVRSPCKNRFSHSRFRLIF